VEVSFAASMGKPTFVGAHVVFDVRLEPQQPWRLCVEAAPELDGQRCEGLADPHGPEQVTIDADHPTIEADSLLAAPFETASADLRALAMPRDDAPPFIAAGAPWFLALFGRDTLVTSLMAASLAPWHVEGALGALSSTQARARDDFRDAQPGKIAHELR